MMKKYRVVAVISYLLEAEIEAESLEQAQQMARDLDGAGFNEIENTGEWSIINVEENNDGV
jgi:uncharacterized protein Smg (DUF494 family)